MKPYKSILPFTLYIFTLLVLNLDLCCEFSKIPNLLAHFSEHKEEHDDTLWQFLIEDFLQYDSNESHHDKGEHDDLPFHGSHVCQHAPIVFTSHQDYSIAASSVFIATGNCTYQSSFSSIYLEAPFQPPQA